MTKRQAHQAECGTCSPACTTDEEARFEVTEDFRRFSQKEDIFSRSFWDSTIRSKDTDKFDQSYRLPWRNGVTSTVITKKTSRSVTRVGMSRTSSPRGFKTRIAEKVFSII